MKTTLDISDPLLVEARRVAASEGLTLRALVESGLRAVLAERRRKTEPFKLRDASFEGTGLTPEFEAAPWEKIREAIYEGRGG